MRTSNLQMPAAIVSVAGVLAIVFATTKIAEQKIGRLSVIDALRE